MLRNILLFSALLLLCGRGATPPEIVFGQSSPFSGALAAHGPLYRAGILAAFKEVNDLGGIHGVGQLKLISEDDAYHAANMATTVGALLSHNSSDAAMLGFLGFAGTGTTLTALALCKNTPIPFIGPVTGTPLTRKTFNPLAINIRAGYDDEAFAMLDLLLNVKKVRRVAIWYQNDPFGNPSKESVVAALEHMGMTPCYVEWYRYAWNITEFDFSAVAQRFLATRPQGVVMYGVGAWITKLIERIKQMAPTQTITFVSGSWMGDDLLNIEETSNVYATQTWPHPLDTTDPLIVKYQAAMANAYGSTMDYEYKTLEGYASATLAIEVLNRSTLFTRKEFFDIVYTHRMFEIYGHIIGPFSRDCLEPMTELDTVRSSLCECNQGLRFVLMTSINANRKFVPVEGYKLEYSISQCYPDYSAVIKFRPVIAVLRNATRTDSLANAAKLISGLEKAAEDEYSPMGVDFSGSPNLTSLADGIVDITSTIVVVGDKGTLGPYTGSDAVLIGMRATPALVAAQDLTGASFRSRDVAVTPDVRQQLFALGHLLSSASSAAALMGASASAPANVQQLHALYSQNIFGGGAGVQRLIQQTADHYSFPESYTVAGYSGALSAAALGQFQTGTLLVLGIDSAAEMTTLLQFSASATGLYVTIPFDDVLAQWGTVEAQCASVDCARILVTTNLPLWFAVNSTSLVSYRTSANVSDPMEMLGHSLGAAIRDVLQSMGKKITPDSFIETLYRVTVISKDAFGAKLGPYVDKQCATGNCLCNSGTRDVTTYSLGRLVARDANLTGAAFVFDACSIAYAERPSDSSSSTQLVLVVVLPCTVVVLCSAFAVLFWLQAYSNRGRDTSCAPKDPHRAYSIAFTDIQSSTALWSRVPEHMGAAIDAHHEIIRRLIDAHHGYEVKTIGDSFMVAFIELSDAVAFAAAIQKELFALRWAPEIDETYRELCAEALEEAEPGEPIDHLKPAPLSEYKKNWNGLRVRVGIHYGNGEIKLDPTTRSYDYYGTVVNTAARVEAVGNGGQVLVTDAVMECLQLQPSEVTARSLGAHQLRGLAEPVVLHQLTLTSLSGRTFGQLRLDRADICGDEDESTTQSTSSAGSRGSGSSHRSSAVRDTIAEQMLQQARGGEYTQEALGHYKMCAMFVHTLLSTSTSDFRAKTLEHMAKKWRVFVPSNATGGGESKQQQQETVLFVKAFQAMAAKVRRMQVRGELATIDAVTPHTDSLGV